MYVCFFGYDIHLGLSENRAPLNSLVSHFSDEQLVILGVRLTYLQTRVSQMVGWS